MYSCRNLHRLATPRRLVTTPSITTEEELVFVRARLDELSSAFLQQPGRDIIVQKKIREAEASAKDLGSG